MSSTLGPLAIHQILSFTEEDYRRRKPKLKKAARVPQVELMARHVSPKWGRIYELYFSGKDPPPLDYLRSPELLLKFKDVLDRRDMQVVFGHGKPIVLDEDIPQRLVSHIVQAFLRLRDEPSSLDITVNIPYVKTRRQTHEAGSTSVQSNASSRQSTKCAIEIFHIFSKHFHKKLTLELTFLLGTPEKCESAYVPIRPAEASKIEKMELRQVVMYLDEKTCSPLPAGTARKSKSLLLHQDFASEVYGFLDRVHVGTSLTANSALNKLISKLKNRLPVHHLTCDFEDERAERVMTFTGAYWLVLHHFRRDLSYVDVRRLKVPCAEGPAADCALILHYLSSSHVSDFKTPSSSCFSLKMLAALADRNLSA